MTPDLQLALQLADAADAITMQWYRSADLAVRTKSDRSPVSEADEATERALRDLIAAARPDDGILGEEFGTTGDFARRWILDPIDGTKNYIRGIPVWATLIALDVDGRGMVGVVSAPALGRRWWAARGEGAFCNGERLSVSRIATIEESHLSYDALPDFEKHGSSEAFLTLVRRCQRTRAFGDFWSHMLVAEGAIEIAIEPEGLGHWDAAPLQVIVEEAGGRFSTLSGEARPDRGSAVTTNGAVHDAVLELFQ
ncbi:MAG TPA: inositol monophosphatase family protein [Thermoanaerobaculia bacterium]